ncbi:MAG: hypothetical protein AB4426_06400 [Xenococcaceae cyanobacterium]
MPCPVTTRLPRQWNFLSTPYFSETTVLLLALYKAIAEAFEIANHEIEIFF